MEYLRAFPPHYTLFTQMNELHGKLQLLPLRPVGRLHGHEECVEDTMNIGWLSGHGLCLSVCGCVCVSVCSGPSLLKVPLNCSTTTKLLLGLRTANAEGTLGQGHLINIETHNSRYMSSIHIKHVYS